MRCVVRRRAVGVALAAVFVSTAAGSCAARSPAQPAAAAAEPAAAATVTGATASTTASVAVDPTPATPATIPPIRTHPLRLADLPLPPRGPVSVRIERLHVSAPVVPVGSSITGELAVPDSPDAVGWYRHGSVPGAPGVAVLAAHVDLHGVRGVFFDLVELRKGDRLSVLLDGKQRWYRVVAKKQVAKTDVASLGIFDTTGPSRLVLVTCGGNFDRSARSYRDNVVVTAVPA